MSGEMVLMVVVNTAWAIVALAGVGFFVWFGRKAHEHEKWVEKLMK